MIKYIGSKRVLVPHIVRAMSAFPESGRVLDLFSGTSRVARGLKETGRYVIANDHLAYAATLARCYVQADAIGGSTTRHRSSRSCRRSPRRPGTSPKRSARTRDTSSRRTARASTRFARRSSAVRCRPSWRPSRWCR